MLKNEEDYCKNIRNNFSIIQKDGTEKIIVYSGRCNEKKIMITQFNNFSLSGISIPNNSIKINDSILENNISYFKSNETILIGLLGNNNSLNLHEIDIKRKKSRDLGIRTLSDFYYIDSKNNFIITTSNLRDLDTFFKVKINKYDLKKYNLIGSKEVKFIMNEKDSILNSIENIFSAPPPPPPPPPDPASIR